MFLTWKLDGLQSLKKGRLAIVLFCFVLLRIGLRVAGKTMNFELNHLSDLKDFW